jgi:hypothetical protein
MIGAASIGQMTAIRVTPKVDIHGDLFKRISGRSTEIIAHRAESPYGFPELGIPRRERRLNHPEKLKKCVKTG